MSNTLRLGAIATSPPEGYADKSTAVAVEERTYAWLLSVNKTVNRLKGILMVRTFIQVLCSIKQSRLSHEVHAVTEEPGCNVQC